MARTKYPISKEFFPFSRFVPPMSRSFVLMAQKFMNTPKLLFLDPQLDVQSRKIPGYQGWEIEVFIISPKDLSMPAPCLVNFHGGGFVFEGYNSHYQIAMTYARECRCKVIYVRYRLAPRYSFPVPQEDCYAALSWIYYHAEELALTGNELASAVIVQAVR